MMSASSVVLALMFAGCLWPDDLPLFNLERMDRQDKAKPFALNSFFGNEMAMLQPPHGTVPRDQIIGDPARTAGQVDGHDVQHIPGVVDMAMLRTGRYYFENVCAACHGVLGNGHTVVAANMRLRSPPSLISAEVSGFAPGRLYRVILSGYGLMPSFGYRFGVHERWAIVAYMQALQLSNRAVALSDLPPDMQHRAREALQ